MKRLVSVLLSFVMIISILTALPFTAQALYARGKCGDNAFYKFDSSSGTLTISGKGEVYEEFCYNESKIKKVTINNGVTSIGSYAFESCKNLTSISIPNSLSYIGLLTFTNCPKLSKINVATKNKYYDSRNNCNAVIEKRCLEYCYSDMGDVVNDLGAGLILGCKNTKIPKGIKLICTNAFDGCTGLKAIKIPDTVTSIGPEAFKNTSITNLTIPDSVKEIDQGAFTNCKKLNYVKLSKSLVKLDYNIFSNCTCLQNITIPKSVKEIETTSISKNTGEDSSGLNGISLWYSGSVSDWKAIKFSTYLYYYDIEEEAGDDTYDGGYKYYDADKSWVNAYTSKVHFNYKEHKHKWNNKFSKQPTFKAEGIKSCSCSTCKMKFTNVPCNKLVSPTVSKLKAGKKQFTATWKKAPTVAGYQIQYATNAKFKKAKKVTVKKDSTTKKTFKKLRSKKKYYVRVRAYKTINGKKVYSSWSSKKSIKTK